METRITTPLLHCCGQSFKYSRIISPLDNAEFTNRSLEIGRCPRCGALKCELIQYNKRLKKFVTVRPKKKDVLSFIRRLEREPYQEELFKIKYGTKANMSWMKFDGALSLWVYDFNGTKQFLQNNTLITTN